MLIQRKTYYLNSTHLHKVRNEQKNSPQHQPLFPENVFSNRKPLHSSVSSIASWNHLLGWSIPVQCLEGAREREKDSVISHGSPPGVLKAVLDGRSEITEMHYAELMHV